MSELLPCIIGKMGSTTYYETTMTARALAGKVRAASEQDNWADLGIEERMQRDVNIMRVRKTIVPYLAHHPDRFFGSFIVLAQKGTLQFESLEQLLKEERLPIAYTNSGSKIGYLNVGAGELIALDGQHRLVALREVIQGGGSEGNDFKAEVGDDEVCVLFIEFESMVKTRTIFNKINRNAKPTSQSDNIITSETDGFAIVSRWLLDSSRGGPLATIQRDDGVVHQLVNWRTTSLGSNSQDLTTLKTVFETLKTYLSLSDLEGFSEEANPVIPSDEMLEQGFESAVELWESILSLPVFQEALENPDGITDIRFAHDDNRTLLLRPVGQQALVMGLVLVIERSKHEKNIHELMARVAKVDWSADPRSMWRDVIVKPDGKIISKKENLLLASRLVAHLIGADVESPEEVDKLTQDWNVARGRDPFASLDTLSDDQIPEDLPKPID